MRRISIPSPRRTVAPEGTPEPDVTLDDLFNPRPHIVARVAAQRRERDTAARRRPPLPDAARRRADRHAAPHDTPQDPVDVEATHDLPISQILAAARSTVRPARDEGDYLHVSTLIHRCVRAIGLQDQLGKPPPAQQLRLADRLTYRQGEAIAEIIVRAVQETTPAALWGHWQCRCQRTRTPAPCTYAEAAAREPCTHCLQPLVEYVEVPMFNEEYKIVGNPDLLLFLDAFNAFHITELKSITPNEFPELARAKPEHVIQAIFYWWLMHQLGYRLTTHVSIVYVNKGHTFRGEQYKEFTIEVASQVARLDMFLEEAMALKQHREDGAPIPVRTRCNTPEDNLAKKCHVCQACFTAVQGVTRRRVVDLAQLAEPENDPPAAVRPTASRRAPPPTVAPEPEPPVALRRSTRTPGPAAAPARDRPVASQHRLRVPPPRRR